MSSLNRVTLIGHLGADPEMKQTLNGKIVANLRLATTERWTDKQSKEKREATEWHTVEAWGPLAQFIGQYAKKGRHVFVEGKLTHSTSEKDGKKSYWTTVVAREFKFLDRPDNLDTEFAEPREEN